MQRSRSTRKQRYHRRLLISSGIPVGKLRGKTGVGMNGELLYGESRSSNLIRGHVLVKNEKLEVESGNRTKPTLWLEGVSLPEINARCKGFLGKEATGVDEECIFGWSQSGDRCGRRPSQESETSRGNQCFRWRCFAIFRGVLTDDGEFEPSLFSGTEFGILPNVSSAVWPIKTMLADWKPSGTSDARKRG